MQLKSLSIVIVNWNSGRQLLDVVSSIALYNQDSVKTVIIVDNGSVDDSLLLINEEKNFPFQLKIIRNKDNRGFGAACNQGAALVTSEYLLFLNPDTRLFENSLSAPLAYMQNPSNLGVAVVGIQLIDEKNCIARSCARLPALKMFAAQALGLNHFPPLRHLNMHMTDWSHDETRSVDHVIGAFYLIRNSIFKSLGGFDERFFVYLEDLDLSLRVQQAGHQIVFLAEVQAFHAGGGTSRQIKARRLFYSLRSRLLYGFKHFSLTKAWMLLFITLTLEPWARLTLALLRGSWRDAVHTLQGYFLLINSLSFRQS